MKLVQCVLGVLVYVWYIYTMYDITSSPTFIDPQRLLKKRESQKATKYSSLAQSQGGELSPLVTGTSGYTTSSAKKVLEVICTNQDNFDSTSSRHTYEHWVTRASLSLQKSAARET